MSNIVERLTQGQIDTRFGEITDEDLRSIIVHLATLVRHPEHQSRIKDDTSPRNKMFYEVMKRLEDADPDAHTRLMAMVRENGSIRATRFWDRPADLVNCFTPLELAVE